MTKHKKSTFHYKALVHPSVTMEHPMNVAILTQGKSKIVITCDWERQDQTTNHPVVIYCKSDKKIKLLGSKDLEYLGTNFMLKIKKRFSVEPLMRQAIAHLTSKYFMPKKGENIEIKLQWNKYCYKLQCKYQCFGKANETKKIFADYVASAITECKSAGIENLMVGASCLASSFVEKQDDIAKWSNYLRQVK